MPKILFVATVVKIHIAVFHLPYIRMMKELGWETAVAAKNDYDAGEECVIPYCDHYYDIPFARSPFSRDNMTALKQLEEITASFKGVDKSYAIQAGREIRVAVKPNQVKDDEVPMLAREIAKKIEEELEYPGQIKVNVIRETKATEFAK